MVHESLRSFLNDLVDYAGLFPPADLALPEALANYHRYSLGAFKWILARFVCPSTSLSEAISIWSELEGQRPLPLSVLCTATEIASLATQLDRVQEAGGYREVRIEMLETRLPPESTSAPDKWITPLVAELESRSLGDRLVFLETPSSAAESVATALRDRRSSMKLGIKLRCGGPDREMIPSVESLAATLRACVDQGIPFKATAGLHHPIRYFDADLRAHAHGFVNLFAGGLLTAGLGIPDHDLKSCLAETAAQAFHFSEDRLRWRGYEIPASHIAELRSRQFISFGSCSFMEPIEDLTALGWLKLPRTEHR